MLVLVPHLLTQARVCCHETASTNIQVCFFEKNKTSPQMVCLPLLIIPHPENFLGRAGGRGSIYYYR